MKSLALWLALLGLALTTIAALNKPANEGLPIVKSSACSLVNPCDRVNCKSTLEIA